MGVALRATSRKGSLRGVEAYIKIFAVPAFTRELGTETPFFGANNTFFDQPLLFQTYFDVLGRSGATRLA